MKLHLITAAIISALSTSAFAENNKENANSSKLPELVVSADFHPKTAEKTAVSMTQIDKETIESRGAQHIEEVLNLAPNVNVSSGASRGEYFQIRGMGERGDSFSSPALNPSVGVIIDGIDLSRTGGAATLFDINNIDVLRGPQGTTYGSNALAGIINMQSTAPSEDLKVHAEAGAGNYGTRNLGVAAGGALIPHKLLGRVSVYKHYSNGYMKNDYLNRDDTQQQDEKTLRGHLKWFANDDLTVDLNVLHLNINNGYDAFTLDNSRHSLADQPGQDTNLTNAIALKTDWHMNDAVQLQSALTYTKAKTRYSFDDDWVYPAYDPVNGYSAFEQYDRDHENYSFETKALSNKDGRIFDNSTDWTIGLYYLSQDVGSDIKSPYSSISHSKYKTQNTAVFGQLDTHLNKKLTLISGLRVEYFDANYDDSNNLSLNTNEPLFGGKLGLNYQINPEQMTYTSVSRGYKSGGINNNPALNTTGLSDNLKFDNEYMWNWEAGLKSMWLDRNLITNMNVFYAWRRDAQVKSSILTAQNTFLEYTTNAAQGRNAGFEGSMDWMMNDNFRLLGSLGLLYTVFDDYDNPKLEKQGFNMNGRRQAQSPAYTFSFGGEYYLGQHWTLRANVEGKDDYYLSNSNNVKSNAYTLTNASVDYKLKNWKVSLWGRNLFDQDYATRGFYFPNDPKDNFATNHAYYQKGDPRVFGMTVSYDY